MRNFWQVMPQKLLNCNCLLFATCFAYYSQRNFFRKASCEKVPNFAIRNAITPLIQATLRLFFENSQFVKKLQIVKVSSIVQPVHAICAPHWVATGPPRAASSSTPSRLYCDVPGVVNGSETFSQKIFVTYYLWGCF